MLRRLDDKGVQPPRLLDSPDEALSHFARRKGPVAHAVAKGGNS
jgi:hypothetical protein